MFIVERLRRDDGLNLTKMNLIAYTPFFYIQPFRRMKCRRKVFLLVNFLLHMIFGTLQYLHNIYFFHSYEDALVSTKNSALVGKAEH